MPPQDDASPRRAPLRWLTLVVSAVLSLVLAELVVRTLGLGITYRVGDHQIRLDPAVLYRNVPGSSPELNALGYRDRELEVRKGDRKRVFLVGDSFVAAWGVPREATVGRALERRLGSGFEVASMGVSGYGPDQGLLRLRTEGFSYAPDRVVLALFAANDFNDLYKNELFALDADGGLSRTDSNPVSRFLPALRLFAAAQVLAGSETPYQRRADALFRLLFHDTYDTLPEEPTPPSARKIALMRGVLTAFRRESAARAVGFAVVVIPNSWAIEGFGPPDARPESDEAALRNEALAVRICRELELPVVDLGEALRGHPEQRLYLADGHWTVAGHALAAEAIARELFGR